MKIYLLIGLVVAGMLFATSLDVMERYERNGCQVPSKTVIGAVVILGGMLWPATLGALWYAQAAGREPSSCGK